MLLVKNVSLSAKKFEKQCMELLRPNMIKTATKGFIVSLAKYVMVLKMEEDGYVKI